MAIPFKKNLGRLVSETLVHTSRLSQPGRSPRLVVLPFGSRSDGSANLRAWNIGGALRGMGWRVSIVPSRCNLSQRQRIIRWERPDLIFLQKGRHPLNWPKYYPGAPIVFDLDDADFLDDKERDQLVACCSESRAVIAGSVFLADWCRQYNPHTSIVWTGSPIPAQRAPQRPSQRRPIIAWAQSDPHLATRDAATVREILSRAATRSKFEFWLYGIKPNCDPEFVKSFTSLPIPVRVVPHMSYDRFLESLQDVAVGLNPVSLDVPYNYGKSFGKTLAYLSSEVAIVCSNDLEMPRFFRNGETGMLVDSIDQWVDAACRLIEDPALRQRMAEQAFEDFKKELSIESASRKVDKVLREVLADAAANPHAARENHVLS